MKYTFKILFGNTERICHEYTSTNKKDFYYRLGLDLMDGYVIDKIEKKANENEIIYYLR